ncbi:hypothetical protein ACFXGI_02155 [Streptomyces sp. NPDC059355]|uniref:hypothetical protein n=1 Tax=Streptomyces sp. NPDC059355 TaxID=3346811 RepID=UPI003681FD51
MPIQIRRGSLVQDRFPDLVVAALDQLPTSLVLDGELMVWDPEAGACGAAALAARTPASFVTGSRTGS